MIKVYTKNLTKEHLEPSVIADMKRTIRKTVDNEYPKHHFEVSLTFCDNAYIQSLNAEYRGKDMPTDVLSFPMFDFGTPDETVLLGDIVISLERAHTQAAEYGHSFRREMCFLCAHSALHLLGYDHEDGDESRKIMENKQEEILVSLGITRD